MLWHSAMTKLFQGSPGYRSATFRRREHRDTARRRVRLEPLEERCLLSGISSITEFPLPSGSSLPGIVGGITAGPDGDVWFSDPAPTRSATSTPPPTPSAYLQYPPPVPVPGRSRPVPTATSGSPKGA